MILGLVSSGFLATAAITGVAVVMSRDINTPRPSLSPSGINTSENNVSEK